MTVRRLKTVFLAIGFLAGMCGLASAATTLLPTGEQCFQTATGPVSSGSVNMYQPATTTVKTTWQNSSQSVANTAPIQLDANGCAIIYGVGSYRQQLYSGPVVGGLTTGNLIFDLVTTDTSAFNSTFWAGVATGTANVIAVVDTGFNATDGSVINFTPIFTNTGAATLNPSGFGAITIEKDTTNGPVALVGGEIACSGGTCNVVSVVYRSSDNAFHILNPVIVTSATGNAPLCGATGYTAKNDGGSPNTSIDIVAGSLVTVAPTGLNLSRTNVSVILNASTNGANGLDTGALGSSTVYFIWLIDNGSAPASLLSLSSTAPTMPAGYTYKCRLGAWITDGSSHFLVMNALGQRTWTTGAVGVGFITTVQGTCFSNAVATVYTKLPLTATFAIGYLQGAGATQMGIATANSSGQVIALYNSGTASVSLDIPFLAPLSTPQTLFICNTSSANVAQVTGWIDAVNAQ